MWNKIKQVSDLVSNMGLRYVSFRVAHMLQVKTGFFKKKFPSHPKFKSFIQLEEWRQNTPAFFIDAKDSIGLKKELSSDLVSRFRESKNNQITFFNSQLFQLSRSTQWTTNPTNNYQYDNKKHWSEIADLSQEAGDIKFVWEKARFSYLYDVLRYDYHSEEDQASFVFSEIEDFIDGNPINLGPQYKCSQEISLRVMNWTYALYYYKNSPALTAAIFDKIMNSIYWQLHHVRNNIHFSRIAVRNNHAITETLMLYLSGLLFPFMADTKEWSFKGGQWLEQEIEYQIYPDGTFLQYSMNYHRVVVQLLTWAIRLKEVNGLSRSKNLTTAAEKSLHFLYNSMDLKSGQIPNYGNNDGALFFKFTDDDYRVYRSQLDDLRMALYGEATANSESFAWYGMSKPKIKDIEQEPMLSFENGGYYIINDQSTKTFIRCGAYKDRPAQADNLHLDLWKNGINYLWDNGSYKYNTSPELIKHFTGTAGHNTVSIEEEDQMLKGSRFIWFYWVKKASAHLQRLKEEFEFKGQISAFRHLGGVQHHRRVKKEVGAAQWEVQDRLSDYQDGRMMQHWHVNPEVLADITIKATDANGNPLEPQFKEVWNSSYYGVKTGSTRITFVTSGQIINTHISIA